MERSSSIKKCDQSSWWLSHILIKPAGGDGGIGMYICHNEDEFLRQTFFLIFSLSQWHYIFIDKINNYGFLVLTFLVMFAK